MHTPGTAAWRSGGPATGIGLPIKLSRTPGEVPQRPAAVRRPRSRCLPNLAFPSLRSRGWPKPASWSSDAAGAEPFFPDDARPQPALSENRHRGAAGQRRRSRRGAGAMRSGSASTKRRMASGGGRLGRRPAAGHREARARDALGKAQPHDDAVPRPASARGRWSRRRESPEPPPARPASSRPRQPQGLGYATRVPQGGPGHGRPGRSRPVAERQ